MKYYFVYETKNLKNGKIYIGIHETEDLNDGYLGSGLKLKRSIRYYGKKFFERKILFYCNSREELIKLESKLVNDEFVNRTDTYNLTTGGHPDFTNHKNFTTKEISRKGRVAANVVLAKRKHDDINFRNYVYRRISEGLQKYYKTHSGNCAFKGLKHKEDSIIKMKETKRINNSQQGCKNSQFGTCWITNGKINKKIKKGDSIPNGFRLGRKLKMK